MKYILIILLLCGCYSERKATQQFSRAAVAYPAIGANYCATTYPVHTVTDSSDYTASLKTIDSLTSVVLNNDLLSQDERASLITEIERIRSLIVEPEKFDSLRSAIFKLVDKEKARGDKLQVAYNNLVAASHELKPIHDTVENTAAIKACQIDNSTMTDLLAQRTAEVEKYKGQAHKRGIFMWSFIGLIIAYCAWKVYNIFKPKIKTS
jgi:hypothetical protein